MRAERACICTCGIRLSRPRSSRRLVERQSEEPAFRESQQEQARQPQRQQRVSGRVGDTCGVLPMTRMPAITVAVSVSRESEPGSGSSANFVGDECAVRPVGPCSDCPGRAFISPAQYLRWARPVYARLSHCHNPKAANSFVRGRCDPPEGTQPCVNPAARVAQRLRDFRSGPAVVRGWSPRRRSRDSLGERPRNCRTRANPCGAWR